MKHKANRVLAFLLSMLMLINSVPLQAFATEDIDHDHDHDSEVLAAAETGHTHSLTFVDAKDANCTEDGNIAYFYCDCGMYFYDQDGASEIPADSVVIPASHSWDEGVVTAEATETAEGVMTYTCTICAGTREDPIPKLQHTHVTEKAEDGEYWVCTGCGSKFADEAATTPYTPAQEEHVHTLTAHEAVKASCTENGSSAYWSCPDCGKFFSDEGVTEIPENSWVIPAAHSLEKTEAVEGTCVEAGNTAYWTCSECGSFFSDEGVTRIDENSWVTTGSHSLTEMEAVKASCTLPGTAAYWVCGLCGQRFADGEGTTAIDYVAHTAHAYSGHTWDFNEGSATSTDGGNTLSLVKTSVSGVTDVEGLLTDGTLAASKNTTMQLSEPVTLTASEDWTIEFVAKGNGSTAIRSFLSTGVQIGTATYLYISSDGDLSLVKKGSFTAADGTEFNASSNYNYYKVSNADYEASALASENFDITEYHCYQLRCMDGVFSYWLDGEKVGDLAMSEQTGSRGTSAPEYTDGTGTPYDFSTLTFTHVGCGSSSNAVSQAVTATVKYLGIYPGHSYSADCDTTCDNSGCAATRTAPAEHTWDEGTVTKESTADEDGIMEYTCTVCGAVDTQTIAASGCAHVMEKTEAMDATCEADGNSAYWTCTVCGKYYADELGNTQIEQDSWIIQSEGHAYASSTVDASCTSHGATIKTCSVCGDSYEENHQYAFSGHTWEFAKSNASNKGNALTKVYALKSDGVTERANGTVAFADGVMTGKTVTMELDETVVLSAEEDWAFEAILKTASASTSPKVLLAESNMFSEGTSIFLYKTGDLYLAQRDTNAKYWYFKVSDADFDANMPADFDITEYHTYRMECNDGVFSYWLDGEKIGDLAITSNNQARASGDTVHEGMQLDYSTINGKYIGSGNSGSLTTFGFSGDLKYLGIYPGHSWTNACDTTCDNTGCTTTRTIEHSWDDGVVTSEASANAEGVMTYTCSVCQSTKTEVIPATDYAWDFEKGEAVSTFGTNTLSLVTTLNSGKPASNGTFSVADGVMTVNTASLELAHGVKLFADTKWAFEITMKAHTNSSGSVISPKTLLAEDKQYANGTSIYLGSNGSLSLLQKGTLSAEVLGADAAVNDYWYFRVSDADLAANMPADFDMTQYHTYRMECSGETFTYWLDGTKIGDLSYMEALNKDAECEGKHLDYSSVTAKFIGNGSSSNIKQFGFTGDVEQMRIITGDAAITHVHNLTETAAKEATCTSSGNNAYWTCSDCGLVFKDEAGTEETTVEAETLAVAAHTPGEAVEENRIASTCTVAGSYDEVVYCSVCKTHEISRETKALELAAHTPGEAVEENRIDSTCTVAGSYDEVVYCSVCKTHEISRETKALELAAHTPGEAVEENRVDSTCTVAGFYDEVVYCSVCKTHEISRETKALELAAHTPGEVVEENRVASTCTVAGSYDEVVYCSVCETYEMSRETKALELLSHSYGEPVFTWAGDNTCKAAYICSVGGETETVDCTVTSESADATCTTPGTVTFTASVQIGEKTYTDTTVVTGTARGHSYGDAEFVWAEDGTSATASITCSVCEAGTDGHTLTGTATVIASGSTAGDCQNESTITYTAVAELNGKAYSDAKTVVGAYGPHIAGEAVEENRVDSTCTVAGSYDEVVYCSVCETHEISRETKALELAAHTPGEAVEENRVDSTCTVAGSYDEVVYCSVCGDHEISRVKQSIDQLAPHELTKVEAVDATCAAAGNVEHWNCSVCEKNFADENATEVLESVEIAVLTDYVWDFSQGTPTSTNGQRTFSYVTSHGNGNALTTNGTMTFADGVMTLNKTALELDAPISLSSEHDWTFEITMTTDGKSKNLLAQDKKIANGVSIHLTANGSLGLMKHGTLEGRDKADYWIYRVSDEDFQANMPADFDVTEFHTYRLDCQNGVFSYWLDGNKIGDLSVTRNINSPIITHEGAQFDYSDFSVKYMSNGTSSNVLFYGVTGDVKELAVYPAHNYSNSCDATCDNDGCTHTRVTYHTWDEGKVTTQPSGSAAGEKTYTCAVCGETKTEKIPAYTAITMAYDDRLAVTELGQTGEPVITTESVTSKKVGTDTLDDAVVTYVDGKLIAVGVGTALATWGTGDDAVTYQITVEPATISMLMVTGHSLGSGSQGDAEQSIICEEGQVYSTNERAYAFKICTGSSTEKTVEGIDVTGMGLGYSSELRPTKIDALNESGDGVNGMDSALGYRWTQLTGEKVWILNSAKGSTSLQTWQAGGYNYRHAVELFTTAEEILYNEVQAGHYNVNKLGIVNYTTANGDQTWSPANYTAAFNSMWEGFQEEMAIYDFDGDGTTDTVDCIGLLPLWNVCSMNSWDSMNKEPLAFATSGGTNYYGKQINYAMSAFEDKGVILASNVGRSWTSDADVAAYFAEHPIEELYGTLQNGSTHTSPTTLQNGVYGDGVHYAQLGYNVQGVETAESMYEYWYGKNDVESLKLLQGNGVDEVPAAIEIAQGKTYVIVPDAAPTSAKLRYQLTGDAVSYSNCILTANEVGTATLTIQDQDGKTLKTVDITVREATDEDYEDVVWYSWDFANGSATNTSGSSLNNTLSLVKTSISDVTAVEDILVDGTLAASATTTMKLSKSIKLDSSKDWAVELVAKGNGTDAIRTFLSTGVSMSASSYFYIDNSGDLSIVRKTEFTADDGTAVANGYTYYKVSDADFAANMPAGFDVTQYHSYQLRCEDGVFSYWLDGEKIGDLALSEQTTVRGDSTPEYTSGNGTPYDFSAMTMNYVGTGSTSNSASQGLTATVKELNLYADSGKLSLMVGLDAVAAIDPMMVFPGDVITLPKPDTGDYCAKFIGWADNQDGTGTVYAAGDSYTVTGFAPVSLYGIWDASETTDGIHSFVNGICTNCGSADKNYIRGYVWDFEDGQPTSTDGQYTFSLVTTHGNGNALTNGTMTVADGVMSLSKTALELNDSIRLTSDKTWVFDITMKTDATKGKNLLAENKKISVGTSIHLSASGSLGLMKHGTLEGREAADYWIYQVSAEDFKANMPADFDITEYHTYQLRCEEGVFSYWLDGKKIGDLSITKNINSPYVTHEGAQFDYSDISLKYMSNGVSGNVLFYGVAGEIEQLRVFPEVGAAQHLHAVSGVEAAEATCTEAGNTEYWTCGSCGKYFADAEATTEIEKDSWILEALGHSMTAFEAKDVSCAENGNSAYWSCSVCGGYFSDAEGKTEIEENSWIIESVGHIFDNDCDTTCNVCDHTRETTHVWDEGTVTTAPTEDEKGVKTFTCTVCGETRTEEVPAVGHIHKMTKNEAKEATCTEEGSIEYWTCSVCGKHYAEEEGANELAENDWITQKKPHALTKVEAEEATCVTGGHGEYWTCSNCDKLFSDEAGTTEIESVEHTAVLVDHVWAFAAGSAASSNGNTLTKTVALKTDGVTERPNGTVTFADGLMTGSTITMDLSEPVQLNANKGWMLEATLKAKTDSDGKVIAPRVLLAESNMFSEGTSIFLYKTGDLYLAQKGTVKGSNAYWYFKVSDADFDANMPADFDITEYHTYRMECNDGVFSYWLDGEKIGDLAITSSNQARASSDTVHEGMYLDYSSITGKYIGSGNSGSLKTFGFTGELKELGIYPGHSYSDSCDDTCNNEGCTHIRDAYHTWDAGKVITEATETTDGETLYTCVLCGKTETRIVPALGHIHDLVKTEAVEAGCDTAGSIAYWTCSKCGKFFSDENGEAEIEKDSWITEATGHIWNDGEVTTEATATTEGVKTYTCTGCGETKTEAIPISIYLWNFEDGTATSANGLSTLALVTKLNNGNAASNGTMTVEDGIMSTATASMELSQGIELNDDENWAVEFTMKAHTNSSGAVIKPAALLAEDKQYSNGTTLYLDASGSLKLMQKGTVEGVEDYWNFGVSSADRAANMPADFDMTEYHTYRMECNDGVFSYWIDGTKIGDLTVTVAGNKKDANGKAYSYEGQYLDYSAITAKFIGNGSSTNIKTYGFTGDVEEICIYASAHTHSLTKTEGIPAGCESAGSGEYWTCASCGRYYGDAEGKLVILKDSWILEATGHTFDNDCDATCNNCDHTREITHAWDEGKVTTAPTENEKGVKTFTCTVCGETKTEEVPAVGHTHNMTKTEAKEATCTESGNTAYWTCTVCGKHYAEEEGANELTENEWVTQIVPHILTAVDAVDATCAVEGKSAYWTCSVCEKLFSDENGITEIEAPESTAMRSDHVWDFSQGTPTSTNGQRTFSYVTSHGNGNALTTNGTMTFADGVMTLNKTALELNESIHLTSDMDWIFEITMTTDGKSKNLLAQDKKIANGVSIHLTANGSLGLMKHGTLEGRDKADYWIYRVSDEDFKTNMPVDFDPAEFHTYRLACVDGVFSYWLDGNKIGDLSVTRNINSPIITHEGAQFDYSDFSLKYLSNGTSSNVLFYGVTGDVKELGIYFAHSYSNSCDSVCDIEGCGHTREVYHLWDNGVINKAPTENAEGERKFTCTICGETKLESIPAIGKIVLAYDDRLAIAELGQKGEPVIVSNTITSKKVGTDTLDDAVLTYVDGELIATGVGTATATWGTGDQAIDYNITVEPAAISMLMITGHSLGSGSQGTASKTIVCEEGQVYATNERAYDWKITTGSTSTETVEGTDVTGMGLGYSSTLRPKEINELNPGGGGVNGVDSAVAYQWAKLTGEKIWILNSAKGSTSLTTWQRGGFNYRHAVELFTTAEEIMYNEVQAGHYKLNKMGIVNFTTANGDQTWSVEKYTTAFNSMWEGFQEEMAIYDFDGDGTTDTVDCISLLPLWNVCSMNKWDNLRKDPLAFYTSSTKYYGKLINYAMSYFGDEGVIMGSTVMREWTSDADVAAFFKANPVEEMYGKLQDGTTHTSPTTVRNGVYGDGVHYGQLGYNVQGIDIAQNMYDYWYGNNDLTSLTLLQGNGVDEVPENIQIHVGEEYPIVPEAAPACAKLTYTIDGYAVSYDNCIVTGVSVGTAVLTIGDQDGNALKTVNITVLPAEEEETEEVIWYAWDFSKASATNTSGSSTDNVLSLVKSADSSVSKVEDLLVDGTLKASKATTLALSKPVTLSTSKNWAVELVAKGDGVNSIRSFMSTDVTLAGTYFYIDGNGDLSIVHKGSFKADDGASVSADYTYYKVSDEDFSTSVLDSGSFDITQYHSYQLRCTNGTFSYWLDGEKIGDLTLSEQTTVRGDSAREYTKNNGTPFDFSNLVMTNIGCGSSTNAASQGMTAEVKELKIYTNSGKLKLEVGLDALATLDPLYAFPGESLVLPSPNNGEYCAKFLGWAENPDGTGKRYQAGDSYTVTGFEPASLYGIWQAYETSDGVHTFVDGICTSCGTADGSFYPWDFWDFEDDTAIADDGVNTISRIATNHAGSAVTNNGTMTVSGGVMHVGTAALELSEGVELNAAKDWAFEIKLKAHTDSNGTVITPKTLLAEDKLFSVGTSFYLTDTGDMLMAQKGTVEGKNTYWYLKVSDADFANNMPAGFDITQYHTYRIMCSKGTFSYWLDGEKIGDFALTSTNMSRGGTKYTGLKLDYSSITAKHIGNGNTGNVKAFGFTGDVEQIGIYTESGYLSFVTELDQAAAIESRQIYPGEKILLPKPDTGEYCIKFTGWTKDQAASGTMYPGNTVYTVNGVETFTLYGNWEKRSGTETHTYGEGVVTPPTCAAEGYTTHTCTFCGHEKITDIVEKSAHSFRAKIDTAEYLCTDSTYNTPATYYLSCDVCGLSSEGMAGASTFESGRPGDGYYSVVTRKDWDTAPGITEAEITLNSDDGARRQVMHVMEVDISDPYASIMPSYMGMNPTPGNYKLGTMSQQAGWVEENMGLNVVGAMNTCLSWYDSAYYDEHPELKNEPLGILVIDGELYSQNTSAKTCLVVNYDEKDGVARPADIPKVELRYTKDGVTGWEEHVVSCNFDFVVKDGKNTSSVSHVNQSSKSVLGIKADGTIVIMQNDGEQAPYSNGMSIYEIGEAMITLGCVYAVRCDGGGTSTYLSQRPGEELAVTCSPADGAERPTTSGILVISSAPATGEFMRASISAEEDYYAPGCTVAFEAVGTDLAGTKVDIPETAVWQVKEKDMGTMQDSVFVSNGTVGTVTVQMVYNDKVVGEKTIEIVNPDTFEFRQSVITVPYGKTVELAMTATVNGGLNTVVLNPDDIEITTTNAALGTFDGLSFTAVAEEDAPADQTSTITAMLKSAEMKATAQLNLGRASVIIDDFEDGISDWNMYRITSRESIDFDFVAANRENGYVYNGDGALGMVMHNETHMQQAGYYAQLAIAHNEGVILENATSVGAWVYVPDDFYNLWIRMSFYTQDEGGAYSKRNVINCVEGGEVYTTIEESGWHYFSCDISEYKNVMVKNAFIEILSQHCSANALYQTTGSPHGMSAIYVDDVTVDYSEAADDREAPVFDSVTLLAGGVETALKKREMVTTYNNVITVKAAVSENTAKSNATGLDGKSAKAYVDGIPVNVSYADGVMTVQGLNLADGAHRVRFEIRDNAGNSSAVIRVIKIASGLESSTIEVVPADPTLDRLYGGSVYWMDLNATRIETIQKVSFDIDLNATNHWELDHMELAEGFTSSYTVDKKTNTATVTITRTGENTQAGKQTLASLPIRVVYFDTDIALEGYTAKTFWTDYNFWPQDVAVDVDRGVIEYVDGYTQNVLNGFSSPEYAVDTEMYTSGQHMDPTYKAQRGTAHVHSAEALTDTEVSCTQDGYTGRTYCAVCDSVVAWGTTQSAIGHKYVDKNGVLICENCGEKLNGVLDGKTYVDGVIADGWVDDTYYYEDGVMITGQYFMDGKLYTFGEDGVYDPDYIYNGFYETTDGKLMYFMNNEYVTGYYYLVGEPYVFDENGFGYEGEYTMAGETCLFENGQYVSCSTANILDAGVAGENATYVLYADGTLVLDGTGATYSTTHRGSRPFAKYTKEIKKIEIGSGITRIGTSFLSVTSVANVVYEEGTSLTQIGSDAFYGSNSLKEIVLPDGVTYVGTNTFANCENLTKVVVPASVIRFGEGTFKGSENVTLYVADGSYALEYAIANNIPYVIYNGETGGEIVEIDGVLYYYKDGSPCNAGLFVLDGNYYYADANGKLAANGKYSVEKTNGLMEAGEYYFDEYGRMCAPKNGIVKEDGGMYYYVDGVRTYAGLIKIRGDYYYVNSSCKVVTGRYRIYKTNGLMEADVYNFDETGKMILGVKNGIVEEDGVLYYYVAGEKNYAGLIEIDGDYYYVNSKCIVVTGRYRIYKTNGLMEADVYTFDENGKMLNPPTGDDSGSDDPVKNGIVAEDGALYYYVDGVRTYAGLIQIDGDYYYVNSSCKVVTGRYRIYKTNGLMEADVYNFDETGKMILGVKNGIVEEDGALYYYVAGEKYYAGLIQIDGNYYYVNSSCKVVTGRYRIYKTNGLMEADVYTFDETGKMIQTKEGIFEEDGTLYYYVGGEKYYAGLIQIDGDYYYVNSKCIVVTGRYRIYKTNGLMEVDVYTFDETGKMILE